MFLIYFLLAFVDCSPVFTKSPLRYSIPPGETPKKIDPYKPKPPTE